jgi:hemerythrin superfamily protein
LKDLVEHHAEEEEKQMFPRARRLMEKEQLLELGRQLAEAKQALLGSKGKALVTA